MMHRDSDELLGSLRDGQQAERLRWLIGLSNYGEVFRFVQSVMAEREATEPSVNIEQFKPILGRLHNRLETRRAVATIFRRSAIATGVVMIGSVAVIPFVQVIHCLHTLAWFVAFGRCHRICLYAPSILEADPSGPGSRKTRCCFVMLAGAGRIASGDSARCGPRCEALPGEAGCTQVAT